MARSKRSAVAGDDEMSVDPDPTSQGLARVRSRMHGSSRSEAVLFFSVAPVAKDVAPITFTRDRYVVSLQGSTDMDKRQMCGKKVCSSSIRHLR